MFDQLLLINLGGTEGALPELSMYGPVSFGLHRGFPSLPTSPSLLPWPYRSARTLYLEPCPCYLLGHWSGLEPLKSLVSALLKFLFLSPSVTLLQLGDGTCGGIFLSMSACLVTQLCPTLTSWTVACQAPLSMEYSRQESPGEVIKLLGTSNS